MSTLEDSEYTLCPSKRSQSLRLIKQSESHSIEKSQTRIVQYINPATYIERPIEPSERTFSEEGDGTLDDIENIYDDEIASPREAFSVTRICKMEDGNELALERQRRYEEWLRNKRELARQRQLRSKAMEEREERETELKKKMSREKVLEWMSKKSVVSRSTKTSEEDANSEKPNTLQVKRKSDKELNFDAWLKNKEKRQLEDIERQKREQFREAQYDLYRKCLSTAFYNKWTTFSREKPRPVPFNQGFASLAGSTTNLYVNPQPWNDV